MSVHVISQSFSKLVGWNLSFQRKTAKSEPGLSVAKYKIVMFCLYNPGVLKTSWMHTEMSLPGCCVIQWSLMPRWTLDPAEYRMPQAGQDEHCWAALRNGLGSGRQLPVGVLNSWWSYHCSEARDLGVCQLFTIAGSYMAAKMQTSFPD